MSLPGRPKGEYRSAQHEGSSLNRGLVYAALSYVLWGLFPLYFHRLDSISAVEIVLHRSVWSMLLLLIVLTALRRWAWLGAVLRQPKQIGLFLCSAILLSANWLIYVWAVNHHRVIDASLGYFINPLFTVLLGYALLHERLRRAQWIAIGLAAAAVLWLSLQSGHMPWISLMLAVSFGLYGLMRKTASLQALEGLALETLLLAPLTVTLLAYWTWQGRSALATGDAASITWLVLAGPLTAVPLLLFAAGARRIPLAALGLLQYITPSLQFAIGVWIYHEPLDANRLTGFMLIWMALVIYSAEGWWVSRRMALA